jgi:hypothetical protein
MRGKVDEASLSIRGVDIDPERHECASITGDIAGYLQVRG